MGKTPSPIFLHILTYGLVFAQKNSWEETIWVKRKYL